MKSTKLSYLELIELPDGQLAEEGFRRNDHGGIVRISAIEKGRTFGLWGWLKGVFGRKARKEIQEARLKICEACTAKDSRGERLFRLLNNKHYCGLPRLSMIVRDEKQEGCGCELSYKASRISSSCPLDRWPSPKILLGLEGPNNFKSKGCGCGKVTENTNKGNLNVP